VHATPAWSAPRLASSREDVAEMLLAEFFAVLGVPARQPVHLAAHRWSLARPGAALQVQCLWRREHALGLCGDWCLGGRMEGAFLSGTAAAGRVLGAGSSDVI
jgi:predicted NAD/FAD-dependent oxidoreductase